MKVQYIEETSSLMTLLADAERWAKEEELVVLSADYQTAGRGQRGNHWESEKGKNLLLGILLRPHFLPVQQQYSLSEITALSLCEALRDWNSHICIKWPNDLYCFDQKLGGILLEHQLSGTQIATTVVGIGVNIHQQHFFSDAPNPISLCHLANSPIHKSIVLERFLQHFQQYYKQLKRGETAILHAAYLERLYRRQGLHPYRDAEGTFMATFVDVLPNGTLVLQDEQGVMRHYQFKQVQFILPNSSSPPSFS